MNFKESSKKQSELTDFIIDLFALDEAELEQKRDDLIKRLENIYRPINTKDKFRHNYSQIFGTIISLEKQDDNVDNSLAFTNLSYKLKFILESYERKEDADEDVFESIRKLYDHINLDIARLDYNRRNTSKLQSKIDDLNAKTEELQKATKELKKEKEELQKETKELKKEKEELQKATKELRELSDETRKELKNSKVDYITILGIFASIIMACVGTMAFSTSVLNNMKEVSIYRLITVALIIGFIFFNIIWLLTVFINKIHDKKSKIFNIAALVFNSILIAGIIFNVIAFNHNLLDNNKKIINNYYQVEDIIKN